jgi:hypothetical protein
MEHCKTIESIHYEKKKNFKKNDLKKINKNINSMKRKIEIINKELKNIENINEKIQKIKLINNFKFILNDLEEKHINYINNNQQIDYYLNTCEILYDYYNDTNISKSNINDENDFECNEKNDLNLFLDKFSVNSKKEMYKEYIKNIDENIICKDIKINKNQQFCRFCKIEKTEIQSEGSLVCMNCGDTEHIIIECDKPSYKEPPPDMMFYYYKRLNHFTEWLNNFQAKETTNIPNEIYDKLLNEFKKQRIYDIKKITHSKLRKILKKLKLNRYYEHINHIMNKLNGKKPVILSRELEEKLRLMFKEIQEPFQEVCPKNRKNFLSYSYVIRKFLELLGQDIIATHFPTLKSREKLYQQDLIWKGICNILQWDYIPSI